jgi:adenosylhomocysteine nucleosidase
VDDPSTETTNPAHPEPLTHVGIVVPTSFELAPYLRRWPHLKILRSAPWEIYETEIGPLIVKIIVSYIGPANAAAATERLITLDDRPQTILHGGAAGAIKSLLMPGDIVLGSQVKTLCSKEILEVRRSLLLSASAIRYLKANEPVHVDSLPADEILLKRACRIALALCDTFGHWTGPGWPDTIAKRSAQATLGTLGSQDGWTKSKAELNFLNTTFGADTEDMESAYVAQIAAKHGIPFLAVRVVSNNEHVATLAKAEILPAIGLAAERAALVICALVEDLAES